MLISPEMHFRPDDFRRGREDNADVVLSSGLIGLLHKGITRLLQGRGCGHNVGNFFFAHHLPKSIGAEQENPSRRYVAEKCIHLQWPSLPHRAIEHVSLRVMGRLFHGHLAQFYHNIHEGMVAGNLTATFGRDQVSPTVSDVRDVRLVSQDQGAQERGPSSRHALGDQFVGLLKGFRQQFFQRGLTGAVLAYGEQGQAGLQDVPGGCTGRQRTGNLAREVSTHPVGQDQEGGGQGTVITRLLQLHHQYGILVMTPLPPDIGGPSHLQPGAQGGSPRWRGRRRGGGGTLFTECRPPKTTQPGFPVWFHIGTTFAGQLRAVVLQLSNP
jgi:hypothetical protein